MEENKDKLIYHWNNIMEQYRTLMITMESADLGELIQELLVTETKEELKYNTVNNKAVSYILTLMSENPYIGHAIKEEDDF